MHIRELNLHNVGRFESLKLPFAREDGSPSKIVVLIGNNGAGKTSILKAIATALSWFVGRLRSEKGSGTPLPDYTITQGSLSAAIRLTVQDSAAEADPSQCFNWTISRTRQGAKANHTSDLVQVSRLADQYRSALTADDNFSLPLIVAYPVERSVLDVSLKKKSAMPSNK